MRDNLEQGQSRKRWIQDMEQCVMCGLCLPHCPTYMLFRNEGSSPRGRILLMQAIAKSRVVPDEKLIEYLDSCLLCRNCESVCPAKVPFARVMDRARQSLATTMPKLYAPHRLPWSLDWFARYRKLRRLFGKLLWVYHHSGLRRALKLSASLKILRLNQLDAMVPSVFPWLKYKHRVKAAVASDKKVLALFGGCAGEVFDTETLNASKRLLKTIGFEVAMPGTQNCCGALHQHAGNKQVAEQLLQQNAQAFRTTPHVISCASGCGIQLDEHAQRTGIDHEDIHTLLLKNQDKLRFMEFHKTVSLHTPCTMHSAAPEILLKRIPGLHIKKLSSSNLSCCGAAGANLFKHPDTANRLLAPLLDKLVEQKTSILLSTNIGCILHFRKGIRQRNLNIRVMHPVVLLNQQYMH